MVGFEYGPALRGGAVRPPSPALLTGAWMEPTRDERVLRGDGRVREPLTLNPVARSLDRATIPVGYLWRQTHTRVSDRRRSVR